MGETINTSNLTNTANGKTLELLRKQLDDFVAKNIFLGDATKVKISLIATSVADLDYEVKEKDVDSLKIGEYTINSEIVGLNYEGGELKIEIPDLLRVGGSRISEVMTYIVQAYGAQYHLPGFEYGKYLLENPEKVPEKLKNGKSYYLPGSLIRNQNGVWSLPAVSWYNGKLDIGLSMLIIEWNVYKQIILIKK